MDGAYDAVLLDDAGVLSGAPDAAATAALVARCRAAGLRTAVVSNAEGPPRPGLAGLVDVVLLSGETGVRKPDPEAFLLAARRLGVAPERCVLVDDLPANVRGAVAAGMTGVLHTSCARTAEELAVLLPLPAGDSV